MSKNPPVGSNKLIDLLDSVYEQAQEEISQAYDEGIDEGKRLVKEEVHDIPRQEYQKLIHFFNTEGASLGNTGDSQKWTTADTAIHFMKEYMKLGKDEKSVNFRDLLKEIFDEFYDAM